jgi:SPRY domain
MSICAIHLLMVFLIGSLSANRILCSRGISMGTRNLQFLPHENVVSSGIKVTLTGAQKKRVTLSTTQSFLRSESNTAKFSVKFDKKEKKTAIGFSAVQPPVDTYLTPEFHSGGAYISMGGAGFIYPLKTSASRGYMEGDTVTVQLDFTSRIISFSVNGDNVGSTSWHFENTKEVFPFISCEGGLLEMSVWSGSDP